MDEPITLFLKYLLNIYHFILILAPALSVMYIILGGIKVTMSSGNADKLLSARKTIINAIIGCVIVLLAYPILIIIASFFYVPAIAFLDLYSSLVTFVALIYICWGGIEYTTSSGDPKRINHARRTIHFAIEGYVWMLFVRIFFDWLMNH